jgi:SAM-dependent methyltransferase
MTLSNAEGDGDERFSCISCRCGSLVPIYFSTPIKTVTSDCRPWSHPLRLGRCGECGLVQSIVDDTWRQSARHIYRQYDSYFQSSLKDQLVFADGQQSSRTRAFIESALSTVRLPRNSSVLDFGCGSGNVLRTLSSLRPDLILDGYDLDSRAEDELRAIPNFRFLHSNALPMAEKYDLIVLSHTLEHFERPAESLQELSGLLTTTGSLAIAVPDCSVDPLKLTVADHCTHFSPAGLTQWLTTQGFTSQKLTQSGDSRECLVVARRAGGSPEHNKPEGSCWFDDAVKWISRAALQVDNFDCTSGAGVFGTSISGSWILAQNPDLVRFFVDEDSSRSRQFHGHPVLDLYSISTGSSVIAPFSGPYERKLLTRLRHSRPDVLWIGLDELVRAKS